MKLPWWRVILLNLGDLLNFGGGGSVSKVGRGRNVSSKILSCIMTWDTVSWGFDGSSGDVKGISLEMRLDAGAVIVFSGATLGNGIIQV